MACKYKKFHTKCTKPYCEVTDGECQFVIDDKDDICSIKEAYKGGEETEEITENKEEKKSLFSFFRRKKK